MDTVLPSDTIDKLRTLLVSSAKESAFRKVVQATMVRDRQHGPVIELNRMAVHRKSTSAQQSANAPGAVPKPAAAAPSAAPIVASGSTSKTVFAQVPEILFFLKTTSIWRESISRPITSQADTVPLDHADRANFFL
jgi:hypothetical protein